MADPKTVKELSLVVDGVREAIGGRITLLQAGVAACFTIIIAIAGGGYALHREVAAIDSKLSGLDGRFVGVQTALTSATERLNNLSNELARLPQAQAGIADALRRIDLHLAALPQSPLINAFQLSPDVVSYLRAYFKLHPADVVKGKAYSLGDAVPSDELRPMPDDLVQKFGVLKGTKFAPNADGGLVVVAGPVNQVAAVIPPV